MEANCEHLYGEAKSGWATCTKCGVKTRVKFIKPDQYESFHMVSEAKQEIEGGVEMADSFVNKKGETVTIHNEGVTGDVPDLKMPEKKEKPAPVETILSSGVVAKGPVTVIFCQHVDAEGIVCNKERIIKVQDKFQVKYCVEHQKQALNKKRYESRKANKAKKKAEAAATAGEAKE